MGMPGVRGCPISDYRLLAFRKSLFVLTVNAVTCRPSESYERFFKKAFYASVKLQDE